MTGLYKLRDAKKAYVEKWTGQEKSTSSTGRGAGSAAASGGRESQDSFLQRLQNETRNLYSQAAGQISPLASLGRDDTAGGTQPQGSLYAQIARQMRNGAAGQQQNLYAQAAQQTPTLSEVRAQLPELQTDYENQRNLYREILERNMNAAAADPYSVTTDMQAELRAAEQARDEASRRYQEALGQNEELSYSERMGNTRTDVSQVAELQDRLNDLIGGNARNADGKRLSQQELKAELQSVSGQLTAVRQDLMAEGYSEDEITALFGYLQREQNAAEMADRSEEWRQAAAERGSLGNLGINVGSGLVSGVGYLDLALQNAAAGQDAITGQRRRVDYNTDAQRAYYRGEATMQGEMDKLLEKYGEADENGEITGMSGMGNFRAGAYQLAVSMGQSAAVAGLTAMGMPSALLLLSGSAATATTHEMHEKGFSDGTALLMGGIAGAAEYVTEKIGMDQLFKTRDVSTAKNVLRAVLRNFRNQALAEGGEEVLSTIINTLADVIVNGDKSELESRYRELMAQGMTRDQAQSIAAREWLSGVWQDFYMGAISGGLFAAGGMAFQSGRNAITDARTGRQIIDAGTVDQLIERINTLDGKISEAANVPESFNTQSSREVGSAARAMERAQVMENMRSELAARGEENASPALLSGLYASSQQEEQRLTPEERRALRGNKTAMELAAEWSRQWGDGTIPAPFEGMENILRAQMEQGENAQPVEQGTLDQQAQRENMAPREHTDAERERRAAAQAAFDSATPVQQHVDSVVGQIAEQLGLSYEPGAQKPLSSILSRMQRNADRGRDSSPYSLKDLARTHLEMQTWDQVPEVLALLDEMKIPYTVDAKSKDGYKGLHVTWQENGVGIELQLSTPEAWAVKMQTEDIYAKWREKTAKPGFVVTEEYLDDIQRCHDLWDQLDVPDFTIFETSSGESRLEPSSISEERSTEERRGPQVPPESSSSSLPDSTENTRPSDERINIDTPPSDISIQQSEAEVNEMQNEGAPRTSAEQSGDGYTVIDHNDTAQIEQHMSDAYDRAIEENRGVTIAADTLAKYKSIANDPTQSLIEAVKDYYDHALKGTTVDVQMDGGVLTIMFENDGKKKSVGWRMRPDKAATFESIRELTEKAVYAYSEANRNSDEAADIPYFHYFVNNADIQNGDTVKSIPVKIQVRDIVTGQKPGMHYYTHSFVNNKVRSNGPSSEAESSRIAGNATAAPYNNSILDTTEKSNTQNNPRISTDVTDRRSLEREYRERTEAYRAAMNRNDTEFDYQGEGRWIAEAERRLQEMGETDLSTPADASGRDDNGRNADADRRDDRGGDARAELLEVGEATVENDTGKYTLQVRRKGEGQYQARISRDGKLDRVQTFGDPQEAAEYAISYVEGQTRARTDAELDSERSEQREKPGPHWPTGREYGEEIIRQKENKAADAATQTLRERIRRANEELKALRRLEKNTGLTQQQRAHRNDVQETLDIMNEELTRRKGRRAAKKDKARTRGAVENKPTRSAAEAKNTLMDQFHTAAGERAEVGRQIEAKLAEIARTGRITEESRRALYDLLIENGAVPKHAESTFREIRDWLRGTRLYVNEQERADLGDNFEDLRRRAWGAGIYLTNDIRDSRIDGVNGELASTFGENLFPTDEALSDMLENMIDQAERGRTVQQSMRQAIEGEARETGRSANEIYGEMFRQMDETLRTFAEKAGLEVELKDRTATQLAEERQRWEDRMERRAQARRESEVRGRVLRGLQRLSRLRGKAGPEIRAQVDEVLKDIDTQARQITPAGLENLQALQRAYEEAREAAGYVDGDNMGNWIPNPYVEEKLASLTKKHVNDMSLEDVVDLGRTVSALENAIRTQNQMIGEEFDATIEESAKGVREDVESSRGAKPGFLHKWLKEEHLSPRRFLDMLGGWKTDGTMSRLSQSLEQGQTRMLDFQRRAVQSFDPFLSKKANRQWLEKAGGKKAEWTSYTVLDGYSENGGSYKTIELTPMMKISLYLHSRNMDNLRHIQTGGIVIPNKALYQQGKMAEAYAQGERVKMNPETVRKIAGELSNVERTFANHMATVFDTISKDAINEVSLQLDGFERAGVENYMPIETDRSFLKYDVAGEARAATVEGIGSIANERIHASNPIMLSDASDVLMRQIDKVSRYYGYAIPIRNFQAVNNYVFHEEGAPFSTSIKEIMDRKWGAGAEQYITKMLEDLQSSGRRGDMMSSALSKLRGNLAGATLMFNPSVAVSQTASYPGAAQAVGWDGLAAGLVAGKVDTDLIEKYSPLYWYRNQGNSTQELGDYMSQKGLAQKLPWILNWIQKMDSLTVRRLWAASEYRVQKDNPGLKPGSRADIDAGKDAYYQKVAEVFNRAVYDTQPNYTNMERAQILRSNSDVTKFLTMYKTVPLQYYGMMVEATGRLQAAVKSGDQGKIAEARKYAVNTFGGLLAANTVYVAMKALFKGFRKKDKDYRDEEGNLTAGSVTAQLGKDLAETFAGSIIGGAEMYSAAESLLTGSKFYGPEMSSLSYITDLVRAMSNVFGAIGDDDPRKAAGAVKDAAVTLAKGFGVPAQNVETYLLAGVRWMFPNVAMEYDNLFGGIERSDMRNMDEQAIGTAANLILQNRTGLKIDSSVTDELARLYSVGELAAIPTATPSSFTYDGQTVEITDRGAYSDTWGEIVGDALEELVTADDYVAADDGQRAALVNKLYQYATVQARRGADPTYSAEGNSTYGWTVKADEAVEAGVGLVDAICALDAFGHMTADKDENGQSISGSKKAKVCAYIDAMDITAEQKNVMYLLSGYKENSLEYTPWHGWDEDEESGYGSGKSSGSGRSTGGKRSGGRSRKAAAPKEKAVKGTRSKIQLPKVSSRSTGAGKNGGIGGEADASERLLEIINKYYGGNALAAAMDGGRKARQRRTEVDFEV